MKKIRVLTRTAILTACVLGLGLGVVRADDTEIFTGGEINVPPNVLIILDTSGSMKDEIETQIPYDPSFSYPGSNDSDGIYYRDPPGRGSWRKLESVECIRWLLGILCLEERRYHYQLSDVVCQHALNSLTTEGKWQGRIQEDDTLDCPDGNTGTYRELGTGNYVNYEKNASIIRESKEDIAKRAIKTLLDSITEGSIRVGLMRFRGKVGSSDYGDRSYRGGYVIAPIGSTHEEIKQAVDNINSSGSTPLAETVAEAGLYFAGKPSWANTDGQDGYPTTKNGLGSNGVYTSPILWRCQKNYLIVVSDGMPQFDDGSGNGDNIFTRANYINNRSIQEFYETGINGDGNISDDFLGTYKSYLPAVAKLLASIDLIDSTENDNNGNGGSWNDPSFPPQTVITYAIGFGGGCDEDFLRRVTDISHGKGGYYLADDAVSLQSALSGIIGSILSNNGNFVAPVVPVNRMNGVYSGNSVYLGLFRPEEGGEWRGNLKKFGFSGENELLDKNGNVADFHSASPPSSCWDYSIEDGIEVDEGGAGEQLLHQSTRNFYTFNQEEFVTNLTAASNAFHVDNAALTANTMGLAADTSAADIADLINYIRSDGDYHPQNGSKKREWVLGDILHSKPAVLRDGDKNIVFVGANDGFLHCFEDDEGSTYDDLSDDDVTEQWCFTPWDLLPKLHTLRSTNTHEYFVDGSPVLHRVNDDLYLTFGLRRGGNKYYTLKVGTYANDVYVPNGYKTPEWAWEIDDDILAPDAMLGQSWSTPRACWIKTGAQSSTPVLILAGGYDAANQDLNSPAGTDTYGRAIYAVNADDGTLSPLLAFTPTNLNTLTHSIVDLISYDSNNDGCDDKIYAGDMGGNVFALKASIENGTWSGRKIFDAPSGGQYKFFYAPDVVQQGFQYAVSGEHMYSVFDLVYIGTGDRAHPNEKTTVNRFYCIKNRDDGTVLSESNASFMDVTTYATAYNTSSQLNFLKSYDCNGWYIRLGYEHGIKVRPGEKVVSSPVVFNGIVYFTTFVPAGESSADDMCAISGVGEGRLYAVDYLTGEAIEAFNFNEMNDTDGDVVLDETDRSMSLGGGLPTAPILAVTESGPVVLVGTSDGVMLLPVPDDSSVTKYFWLHQ
ncbi:MAG: PilC/PilY family type IV pilus protein [Desulfomonilia bacterium]|jgi:type IV pilus assembly protein PilY1